MINLEDFKSKLKKTEVFFQEYISTIQGGAINLALVNHVIVDAYGSKMPLNQLSSLSIKDPRTLLITPFDESISKEIERAILKFDLGLSVSGQGREIYLSLPELNSEKKQILVKKLKEKLEESRVVIRQQRDIFKAEIEKDIEMSDNEKFTLKEKMENSVKDSNKILDDKFKIKEKTILED